MNDSPGGPRSLVAGLALRLRRGFLFGSLSLACAGAPSVAYATPPTPSAPVELTGRAMGTTWTVKFFQPATPLDPNAIRHAVADRLKRLESIFSTYRPQSELSRFNASAGDAWFPCSAELAQVARDSHEIGELTNGAFDATVYPLVQLWGFGLLRRTDSVPTPEEIANARRRVDYRRLVVRASPPALRKTQADVAADFSSMAKGYAVDEIAALLADLGATRHLVQVGGDLKTGTAPPGLRGWRVAIEQPTERENAASSPACVLTLEHRALSTSGNRRNAFRVAGESYGHILDPRTGQPASGNLASVSVIDHSCARSSALATALFALGREAGPSLAQQNEMACLFVVSSNEALSQEKTPEFVRFVQSTDSP